MTNTPKNRDEVVEIMARAYSGAPFASVQAIAKARRALTALEAAGLLTVPAEATAYMACEGVVTFRLDQTPTTSMSEAYSTMLAASPYNPQRSEG